MKQVGQDSGGVGLGGRLGQASADHLLKDTVTPDYLTQSQTNVGHLSAPKQPIHPFHSNNERHFETQTYPDWAIQVR